MTRVPETLSEAKRLLAEAEPDEMTKLPDNYPYLEVPSDYGGIGYTQFVLRIIKIGLPYF